MTLAMHTVHKGEKLAPIFLAVQYKTITMLVFKKKKPSGFQKTMATYTKHIQPCAERLQQSFQTPQKLSSSPSLALGLHKAAAPLSMLVIVFQNWPSAFLSYENLQTLSSLPHHCCMQPSNLPSKVTLWGQTPPSERPSHRSPVIKMRNPDTPVTDCQLVAILPRDMWSHKGVQAIQALDKQFLAAYCSKLPH